MEDNFRNTLIIISAIVIGAFFVHGIWTIRKNKNPYKLKTDKKAEKIAFDDRNFDRSGFDQDGVGQIKVKTHLDESDTHTVDNIDGEEKPNNVSETSIEDLLGQAMAAEQDEIHITNTLADDITPSVAEPLKEQDKPVYQEPVISPKPQVGKTRTISKAELKRNQIEINFGNLELEEESLPSMSATDQNIAPDNGTDKNLNDKASSIQPEVLAISVVMPQNQIIQGAALLPSLLTLGLKYGEMNIFHRHQDNAGNGPVTFSLANMVNPGSFDLDSMETFATQGVTLFMMLPNTGNAFEVYIQMLAAAKQLAQEFQAQLLDDKRNVMTKQTEQHYTSRIRDFEIKNRGATL